MKKTLTMRYALHQMAYWASAAGVVSFATAFLLAKGFPASRVGVLLACGNLLSCAVQPLLADRADRASGNVLNRMMMGLTLFSMVCFGTLQVLPVPQGLFGLLYLLGVFTLDAMMPLMNAISVSYTERGRYINYGLGRGLGSLAFSIAALAIGEVMARFGPDGMIWIALTLMATNLIVITGYPPLEDGRLTGGDGALECCSVAVFFVRYKWYCLSLLGVMLLAMFHAMTENYLIEVMGQLGGDSGSVGVALFIATVAEMPVLVWFDRVRRYIRDDLLLKLAGLSFLLKSVLLFFAPSVSSVYLIQILQATSYAFLSPTQLYYANRKVDQADMVKGQAFITASYTLGCAAGNFAGGQLLEFFNVATLLAAGIVMAAAGTLVLFFTVNRGKTYSHI